MALRKHIALSASATAVIAASMMGVGAASAASVTQARPTHAARKLDAAQAETRYEDRLAKAVTDGKLTADQKTAVLAEHTKLEAQYTAAKALTGTARSTAVKQVWSDAKTWASTNNINVKWLLGFRPHLRG